MEPVSTDAMGPYYDHLWHERQQRFSAADGGSARRSHAPRGRLLAFTIAPSWLGRAATKVGALLTAWRTDDRRARPVPAHLGHAIDWP